MPLEKVWQVHGSENLCPSVSVKIKVGVPGQAGREQSVGQTRKAEWSSWVVSPISEPPPHFWSPHLLCPSLLFLHRKLWVPWPRLSSVTALGGSCSLLQRAFLLKGTWCIRRRRGATIHSTCHFPSGQGCQQWNPAVQESRINLLTNDKQKAPVAEGCWRQQRAEAVVRERAVSVMHEGNAEIDGSCSESNGKVWLTDIRCLLRNRRDVFGLGFSKSPKGNFCTVFSTMYWFAWKKKIKKETHPF